MRNTILTLLMMIAVGVFASAQGRDTQIQNVVVVETSGMEQPNVVLAKRPTRQHKDPRRLNEECEVIPNADPNLQKPTERDSTLMKGLVF